MGASASMRAKTLAIENERVVRAVLIETAGPEVASAPHKPSHGLEFRLAANLTQACRFLHEAPLDVILLGPRLNPSAWEKVIAAEGRRLQGDFSALLSGLDLVHEAADPKAYLFALSQVAGLLMTPRETFALLCDPHTGEPDMDSLQLYPPEKADLAVTLRRSMELGQGGRCTRDRSSDSDTWLWMVPTVHHGHLEALIGVVSHVAADEQVAGQLSMLRFFARLSSPVLAAKRDDQRLRLRVDELEALLGIRSYWLSNLCHEFRSMLAAIRGYSRRLADGRAGPITDVQGEHLGVILKNTDKLLDLVSYSVPFVAEEQIHLERLDIGQIWRRARQRVVRRLKAESACLTEQIPPEPLVIVADAGRLEAVFEILLTCALQCAAQPGGVTVRFLRGASGEVTVKLSARGKGLTPQFVERTFEHGDRGSLENIPEEWRKSGLPLAHDIVWAHGGRIAATGNAKEGIVFTFTLPPPNPHPEN